MVMDVIISFYICLPSLLEHMPFTFDILELDGWDGLKRSNMPDVAYNKVK